MRSDEKNALRTERIFLVHRPGTLGEQAVDLGLQTRVFGGFQLGVRLQKRVRGILRVAQDAHVGAETCDVHLRQTVLARAVYAAGLEWDQREAHSAVYDAERTAQLFCIIANAWPRCGPSPGGMPEAAWDTP